VRAGYSYYPIDESFKTPPIGFQPVHALSVPVLSAKRYALLSHNAPYASDGLWDAEDISHRSGVDKRTSTDKPHVVNGGISCLFKDGHVRFVRDEKGIFQGVQMSVFGYDNFVWDVDIGGNEKPSDVDFRYRFYPVYSLIKP
jgi:hypothetical protein